MQTQILHDTLKRTAIISAATELNAVNGEQVAILLADRVRVDDEGEVYTVNASGEIACMASGERVPVKDMVSEWLQVNPHLLKIESRSF